MNPKNILLLSDTHSFLDESLLPYIKNADEVWHAGDIGTIAILDAIQAVNPKVRAVYGNIDGGEIRSEFPEYEYMKFGDLKVLMIHIGGRLGSYNARVRALLHEYSPDVFVCGHSHILKVGFDKAFNLLYMNPGACGHHGFHKIRTVLSFSIGKDKIHDIQAIELGKRGRN